MATLKFKPDELLKKMRIRKYAVDQLIGAEPYSDRPLTPKEVEEKQKNLPPGSPYEPGKSPMPSSPNLAHHTGGKHFTEPSMDELIQGLINGDIPRGTLGDEETENRMIKEYLNKQKQSLMFNDLKIAKGKKKRNAQRAYEDFVRDSQNMPLDESFKDLRRGIDREGLDIMKDVLGLDEA